MKDAIAKKYCFRASVKILNRTKVPVGVFFSYNKSPTIARDLEAIGNKFCLEHAEFEYACVETELFLHNECPVEVSNEIYFQPFEALDD
jgi:hypothetical protein